MPHRYDDRERRRWRDMDEEQRMRNWDRGIGRGRQMSRGHGTEWDPGYDRSFENRGLGEDFDFESSIRGRSRPGFGYEDEGLGGDYGWEGRLGSGYRGGSGEEYDSERDLRRRNIFDRSTSLRGNYDLPEEQRGRTGGSGRFYGRGPEEGFERGMTGRSHRRDYGQDFDRRMGRSYGRGYGSDWERSGYQQDYDRDWIRGMGRTGYGYDWEDELDFEDEPDWTYSDDWMIPGPFTGIGPEGYHRSDDRIHEDVCERLTQHGQIDASNIEVHVQNGEVTLSGTVNNRHEKRMVEDTIETVSGVVDIHNQLRTSQMRQTTGQEHGQRPSGQQTSGQQGTHSQGFGSQNIGGQSTGGQTGSESGTGS